MTSSAEAAAAPPIIEARGLVKHFASGGLGSRRALLRAVDGVSFAVHRGETLAVVGESGSGKSTLARLLLRLLEPTAGSVIFEGRDIAGLPAREMRRLRRRLQMIFQDPYASLDPRMRVRQILGEGLAIHGLARGRRRAARIAELLELVGLDPGHALRYPHEFSGGQRQRIAIARALSVAPSLIVGDEPVSALDVSVRAQILNLIDDLRRRLNLTLVIISHDLGVVRHIADRVLVLYLGQSVEIGPAAALFARPRHPYTRALLAATPDVWSAAAERPAILEGEVPSPIAPPSGCRFHTRCPHARPRCRDETPALRRDAAGHATACHFWEALIGPEVAAIPEPPRRLPFADRIDKLRRLTAKGAV